MPLIAVAMFGFIVAIVGAWKDTLWEPFRWGSFWRSPIITTTWAVVLLYSFVSSHWLLISLSSVALERLTVEIWKGIWRRKPSKFADPLRDTHWVSRRLHK